MSPRSFHLIFRKLSSVHPFLEYIESIVPSLPAFYSQPILSLLAYRYGLASVASGSLFFVCRFLPELSQQVVNKLLYYSGPIPFQEVRTWFRPAHKAIQNKTLWRLKQLQILQGRGQEVWINETFQRSLFTGFSKLAMKRGGRESRDSDSYARDKWEMVLYELVKGENGSSSGEGVSKRPRLQSTGSSLERLLTDSGLISTTGRVTNSGFQFLLKDISNQIWVLLIHYLKKLSPEQVEANLGFLGEQVLFGQAGRTIGGLQSIDLELYEQFGLVIPGGGRDFSATRLFTSLAGGKNALDFSQTGAESRGFLVVETNYRIYAYTSSPLQIATLGLFIRLQDRFPNLVFGQLDMETVQGAMSHGITADQIVDYLQINVHPCMLEGQSGVPFNGIPFTIIDQIKLWEMGRNRLANNREGYLYQQFLSEKEYDAALGEAKEINALLYAKPASRLLIISPDGHEHMKQFIKSIKQ